MKRSMTGGARPWLRRAAAAAMWLMAATAGSALAADPAASFPSRPIRLLVGFAPGGSADVMARLLSEKLTGSLGVPVVVENRVGAAGTIGAAQVARAAPDGYTLLVGSVSNVVISSSTMPSMPYDPAKDFAPVTVTASVPLVLVVPKSSPVNSVKDLIALAKSQPGKLNYSSGGTGTSNHLAGELFNLMAGVQMVHIPYKGDGPGVAALLAGEVGLMFATLPSAQPHIESGALRAIAVADAQRLKQFPDLPTIAEAGVPGYAVNVWNGVLAPAGTPAPIVARLNKAVTDALRQPDLAKRLDGLGYVTVASSPAEFAKVITDDMRKWPELAKRTASSASN